MLCAGLGDFEADVALVYYLLVYSIDFVTEYQRIASSRLRQEFLKFDAAFYLLKAA